ncbi:MAG: pirin family protein [Pyrinomonadaceae bacterium]
MITRRPAGERGRTRTDWLDSHHTFSFNRYYDPRYTGFRQLLVINEDFVAPAAGFGTHSHQDMEIISYVLEGGIEHRDSIGNTSVIRPGEVQRMSAGTGVRHSEQNASATEPVHFLQIWITPEREGAPPGYEQREFAEEGRNGKLRLIASRSGRDASVTVHQDVNVYDASLDAGEELLYEPPTGRSAWLQVLTGALLLNGAPLKAGDGAAISDDEGRLSIRADERSVFLLFDLA